MFPNDLDTLLLEKPALLFFVVTGFGSLFGLVGLILPIRLISKVSSGGRLAEDASKLAGDKPSSGDRREVHHQMMCVVRLLILCSLCLPSTSSLVFAGERRIGLGAGVLDALNNADTLTGSFIVEAAPVPSWWEVRAVGQFLLTNESGYYLGLGFAKDLSLNEKWSCGLGFSAGLAHDSKENEALDYDVEFYSRLFLHRKLSEKNALRLEFGHISNGGLHDENPGTEPLLLFWMYTF